MKTVRTFASSMLLLSLVTAVGALDPTSRVTQYAHTAWRAQDGSFAGAPDAIAQTADGYLWIGTASGLFRFDGVRFVPWTHVEGSLLQSSATIYSLLGASDGSLWIGSSGTLYRFKNDILTSYSNIAIGHINSIIEDRNGIVWFSRTRATDGTGPLCQVTGTTFQCYGKADGIPFSGGDPLANDLQGNVWIAGASALVRWKPGSSTAYRVGALMPLEGLSGISALAAEPDGKLWVGIDRHGPGMGLQQLAQGAWKTFSTPDFDGKSLEITSLLLDKMGSLWIGTNGSGIYRIQGKRVDRFGAADGLSSDYINTFYEDSEGDIWVATSKGLDRFRDLPVVSYSKREGLSSDQVASVFVSPDSTVWIGNTAGLDSIRDGVTSSIGEHAGFPGRDLISLFQDHDGLLWAGVDNGLYVYDKRKFIPIRRTDGSPMGVTAAITQDKDGNIWAEIFTPPSRLVRIRNRRVEEEISASQVPLAVSVTPDLHDGIWLGLATGALARYRHGRLETFSAFDPKRQALVNSVLVNADGSVFGGSVSGLIEWRDGKIQTLTTQNGLPCNRINAAIFDAQNALWLYTQCGLLQITKPELDKWWTRSDSVVKFRMFDALDGVMAAPTPFQPNAARSLDGRLWFPNGSILQMIDPNHLAGNSIVPPVHIEAVTADKNTYAPREGLRLPALTRDVEIDYTALSFVLPQRVRFRYKLRGHDVDWQEAGTRRQAFYTDLKPGRYTFQVIACNNDGVWSNTGATLDLLVAPAWFQTNWFFALCVATAFFLVGALYRMRVRQVANAMSARFDERLSERTRIAQDLHDTLLQTIQGSKLAADSALKQSPDPVRMRGAMEQLSVWLGRASEEGREALNSLRTSTIERNDLATAFLRAIEECRMENSMEASFSVVGDTREMHPIVRDEVYRIGFEAIRNASVHSQASQIQVTLAYTDDLRVCVADNGVGIAPLIAASGKEGHFGLQGMRERAARIAGKLSIASSPESGTEVQLTVPGRIIYRKTTSDPHRPTS